MAIFDADALSVVLVRLFISGWDKLHPTDLSIKVVLVRIYEIYGERFRPSIRFCLFTALMTVAVSPVPINYNL